MLKRFLPSEAHLIVQAIIVIPVFLAVNHISDVAVERFDTRAHQIPIWDFQRKQETVKLILNIRTLQGICVLCIDLRNCFPTVKCKHARD